MTLSNNRGGKVKFITASKYTNTHCRTCLPYYSLKVLLDKLWAASKHLE